MAANPYIAKLEREKLERQIQEFFAQGNEPKQLGFQMSNKPVPLVLNGKKDYNPKKLPPSFIRESY